MVPFASTAFSLLISSESTLISSESTLQSLHKSFFLLFDASSSVCCSHLTFNQTHATSKWTVIIICILFVDCPATSLSLSVAAPSTLANTINNYWIWRCSSRSNDCCIMMLNYCWCCLADTKLIILTPQTREFWQSHTSYAPNLRPMMKEWLTSIWLCWDFDTVRSAWCLMFLRQ